MSARYKKNNCKRNNISAKLHLAIKTAAAV
jgi:hypothetical protein